MISRNCCKNYSYLFIVSVFVVVVVSYRRCKLVISAYFVISCIFCVVNKSLKKTMAATATRTPLDNSIRAASNFFALFPSRLRWLDTIFQGQYLPSLNINNVAINRDLEKLP